MSYCRWSDGDLYAYNGADGYYVHVSGPAVVEDRMRDLYVEASAQALLARALWLGGQGCDYPWDALRWLKEADSRSKAFALEYQFYREGTSPHYTAYERVL